MNLIKVSLLNVNKHAVKSLLSSRALHISPPLLDKNYYEILRVPTNSSQTEIKEAYYKLSKVYHPDIARDENSLKMFRSITEAYDVLGNVKSRIQYDNETGIENVAMDVSSFHPSGYKDETEFRAIAPDYDKILARKSIYEDWEDLQYKERRIETLAAKNRYYMEEDDFTWSFWEQRLIKFGIFMFVITSPFLMLDQAFYQKLFDPESITPADKDYIGVGTSLPEFVLPDFSTPTPKDK